MQVLDSAKRNIVELLYKLPVVTENPTTTYVSLYTGFDFFNIDPLLNHPEGRKKIVKVYLDLLEQLHNESNFNKLVFINKKGPGPVGLLVAAGEIGERTGLETVVIRSGITCKCKICERLAVSGASKNPLSDKDKVVILTDVITLGSTLSDVLSSIERYGAKTVGVIAFLDREFKPKDGRTATDIISEEKALKILTFMKRSELVYLGFDTPTSDEVLTRDYMTEISQYLGLSKDERIKLNQEVNEIAERLLQGNNFTPGMKKTFVNICVTLVMRTKRDVISLVEGPPL